MADPAPGMPAVAGRPHVSSIRVRYAETDQMGIAYYANYLVWFEVARTDWLRAAGLTYRSLEAQGLFLPVIEAHCAYRAPARYDDALAVRAVARLVSPARLAFDYDITGPDGAVASGSTVHAFTDGRGRPVRVPASIKDLIG
ncbi:MAG: acyl-CoA thioesterase [Vicinamibacterales bacterium]